MNNYGFVRTAAAVPAMKLADVTANVAEICRMTDEAESKGVSLLVFPELSITGYTCGDLFGQKSLLDAAEQGVAKVRNNTRGKYVTVVVGAPVPCNGRLYNCAIVIRNGNVIGIVPKIYLPTYAEFYEARWFASGADFLNGRNGSTRMLDNGKDCVCEGFNSEVFYAGFRTNISPNQLFTIGKATFAVELCEDLWTPIPPSSWHAMAGAQIIVNLSASNEVIGKHVYRKALVANQSARTVSAYIYASCGYGESTQDVVYAGSSMIAENGSILARTQRFGMEPQMIIADVDVEKLDILRQKQTTFNSVAPNGTPASQWADLYLRHRLGTAAPTDFGTLFYRSVDPHPFVPAVEGPEIDKRAKEITSIQVAGLARRLEHIHAKTAVIGISGGLDSTLALLITALAFDKLGWSRERILGITMPGFGTTGRTHSNAVDLMAALGISQKEISIVPAVNQHFKDIGQDPDVHDVTYENSQARERTQLLMDIAGRTGGMVVGTGDLSELALGWATYNGDHMSMYGVNSSIPKTLVKYLVKWAADNRFADASAGSARTAKEILYDIIDTPISPELIPAAADGSIAQKTEDLVGPYELHDFFLYNLFRFGYTPQKVYFLARKAFAGTYDDATIMKWLRTFVRRFFTQQFKRSCMPDGPKVGTVTLSPRGDWRMPSDAFCTAFLDTLPE